MPGNRDGGVEGEVSLCRTEYLPHNTKIVVIEDAVMVIPPDKRYPTSEAEIISIPKGTEATLISSDPICVRTDHGLRTGLLVRVDKMPEEKWVDRLIERKVVIPVESLDIHPDELL